MHLERERETRNKEREDDSRRTKKYVQMDTWESIELQSMWRINERPTCWLWTVSVLASSWVGCSAGNVREEPADRERRKKRENAENEQLVQFLVHTTASAYQAPQLVERTAGEPSIDCLRSPFDGECAG